LRAPRLAAGASGRLQLALLAAAVATAAAARALGFERVFLQDGRVAFAFGDALYHARRSLYSFVNFPRVLRFDPCINYPDGSVVPHPPLLDWAVAAAARLLADSVAGFELVAAWSPVLFGSLAAVAVYLLAAALGRRAVGVGAAWLYALLPVSVLYSQVGNVDHHAAAGMLGALLLASYVALLDPERRGRSLFALLAALALLRVSLVLVWNGSLLYLLLGEIAILVVGAASARRELLSGQALGSLVSAALLTPAVSLSPTPNGGPWSGTELSWLHVLALGLNAGLCGGVVILERWRPLASPAARLVRLAALAIVASLGALALPGVARGLASGLAFVAKSDDYSASVIEHLPLFWQQGGITGAAGEARLGYFAYLLPFVPLAFLLALPGSRRRGQGLFLFGWTLLFGLLGLQQVRYVHDLAPAASVGFALALAEGSAAIRRRFALRARTAVALGVLVAGLLLAPVLSGYYAPSARLGWQVLRGRSALDRGLLSIGGSQLRFAEAVRASTPDAGGCDESDAIPRYGILAHPSVGHALHYVAQRATPSDPFGPYIGRENFERVLRFHRVESEPEAVAIAEELQTPWVVTVDAPALGSERSIVERLQRWDGRARDGLPHLERFRLVTEGPRGGISVRSAFELRQRRAMPHKLFEIVPGALLEVATEPGQSVQAEVRVSTAAGRRFAFRAQATADAQGLARLRVPYANDAELPTRTLGTYRVRAGERSWRVEVDRGSGPVGSAERGSQAG
jgi:4-amino-4-deoxy-L-arabinose transferase-like glycosyltransferase